MVLFCVPHTHTHQHKRTHLHAPQQATPASCNKAAPLIIMIMNPASVCCLLSLGNEFVLKVIGVIAHLQHWLMLLSPSLSYSGQPGLFVYCVVRTPATLVRPTDGRCAAALQAQRLYVPSISTPFICISASYLHMWTLSLFPVRRLRCPHLVLTEGLEQMSSYSEWVSLSTRRLERAFFFQGKFVQYLNILQQC